jgi:two-component system response regulator DesR
MSGVREFKSDDLVADAPTLSGAETSRRLRILVVDDHEVIHWGFRLLLTSESWVQRCLTAYSGDEAVQLAARYEPHAALIDLLVGAESGSDICERLRAVSPMTSVLLMSGVGNLTPSAARAVGASGFVPKSWGVKDIAIALRMVGIGMTVFPRSDHRPDNALSNREREVLDLVAQGATSRQIAQELILSPHTVKDHLHSLYRKLGAKNRAEAIVRAQRNGFLR